MKKNNEMQYYVRKSWEDIESQAGIDYNFFVNAKKACDKLDGYKVYNSNGEQVYPEKQLIKKEPVVMIKNIDLEIGSAIKLLPEAVYSNGKTINAQFFNKKLYIHGMNGKYYIIARAKNGPILGEVEKTLVELFTEDEKPAIESFIIQIKEDNVPLYHSPDQSSNILNHLNKYSLFTIINEKNGFGKIKKGPGWIDLNKVRKLV